MSTIQTTPAGSLPRTQALIDANAAREFEDDGFTLKSSPEFEGLLADAERNHWTVVGTSQDMSTGRTLARMGLREAQSAVRQGLANGILIEDVGRLSHEYSTALRVLEFLQDHGAVLICTQADVRYELYIKGLSQPLQQRAMSKGGIVPW